MFINLASKRKRGGSFFSPPIKKRIKLVFKKKNVYEEYTEGLDKDQEDFEQEAFDKADFNMGSYHFLRYHRLLMIADQVSIEVNAYSNDEEYKRYIHYYYSILKTIYNNIKSGLIPGVRDQYDQKFREMEQERLKFMGTKNPPGRVNHPEKLIRDLVETHANLIYSVDRQLGLGVPRTRQESQSKQAKRALGIE